MTVESDIPGSLEEATAAESPTVRFPAAARDPEFASTTSTILEPGDIAPSGIEPERYLRLVGNPFLGFAGFIAWLLALRWVFHTMRQNPQLIGPLAPFIVAVFLGCLWLIPGLFQYHCLDCGRGGRMSRWRVHACPASSIRRIAGTPRRLRGATPPVQVVLWLWLLLTAAIFLPQIGLDWRWLLTR